jgi:hypothetical protein
MKSGVFNGLGRIVEGEMGDLTLASLLASPNLKCEIECKKK